MIHIICVGLSKELGIQIEAGMEICIYNVNSLSVLSGVDSTFFDALIFSANDSDYRCLGAIQKFKKNNSKIPIIFVVKESRQSISPFTDRLRAWDIIFVPPCIKKLIQAIKKIEILVNKEKTIDKRGYSQGENIYQDTPEAINSMLPLRTNVAREYVFKNYGQPIRVEYLAKLTNMSTDTFSRRFKQDNGATISSFIKHVRIASAKKKLRFTNLPISTISYECGFQDQAYFCRVFRNTVGQSSTEYRKANRDDNQNIEGGVTEIKTE